MAAKSKSESEVAAREQLEQQQSADPQEAQEKQLEEQAKEQEKQQADELKSKQTGAGAKAAQALQESAEEAPAAARAGVGRTSQTPTQGGFMDQMSRRSGEDAIEGHYVVLDLNNSDVQSAYESQGLEGHRGDYGVYLEPATLNPDTGIPETIAVRLRDDTHALVVVPYEAASPAAGRGRS